MLLLFNSLTTEQVQAYVDKYYVPIFGDTKTDFPRLGVVVAESLDEFEQKFQKLLNNYLIKEKQKDFYDLLSDILRERDMTDAQLYRKAGVDRRTFAKLRNQDNRSSLETVMALIIALNVRSETAMELLASSGHTLRKSNKYELALRCFLEHPGITVEQANDILDSMGFDRLLGSATRD